MTQKFNSPQLLFTFIGIGLLYAVFPTHNSTLDAWSYAAEIRHNGQLFSPHHLLYNALGWVLQFCLQNIGFEVDTLALMKLINTVFGVLVLRNLYWILQKQNPNSHNILWLLVVAFSFVFWRFTTENETYIIPIYFSSLASIYFYKITENQRINDFLWTGFWAAVACLFHQIHFWWWLGLGIGVLVFYRQNVKNVACYFLPSLLVPLVYVLVVWLQADVLNVSTIWHFVFYEFYHGNVSQNFGANYFVMTAANTFRTFLQIHGLMFNLLRESKLWFAAVGVSATLFAAAFWFLFPLKTTKNAFSSFQKTHLFVLGLHYLFAFYSVGNAEFMVMLPFLLVLIFSDKIQFQAATLSLLAAGLLVWNFVYGIFPNYYFDFWQDEKLLNAMSQQPENLFIMRERALYENKIYYHTGKEFSTNVLSIPSHILAKKRSLPALKHRIDSTLQANGKVYTDALGGELAMSRAATLVDTNDHVFFRQYSVHLLTDSSQTLLGKSYLTEIKASH